MSVSLLPWFVTHQSLDDVSILVSSKIQAIFTDMSVPNFVVTPKLVAPVHIHVQ